MDACKCCLWRAPAQVEVVTSDQRGAGTDANVYVIMHGTLGDGQRHVLSKGHDDFDRWVLFGPPAVGRGSVSPAKTPGGVYTNQPGRPVPGPTQSRPDPPTRVTRTAHPCVHACSGVKNEFVVEDEELGELLEVTVGHDGTGHHPSWHMDHMAITNTKTGKRYIFPCRQAPCRGGERGRVGPG